MRSKFCTPRSLRVVLLLAFIALGHISASAQVRSDVDPKTVNADAKSYAVLNYSPNRRYALAWGMRYEQIDFARFDSSDEYRSHALDVGWSKDPIDCIIDCKEHKVVATISGCHHFPSLNHSSLKVAWAQNGRYLLVLWDGKWAPQALFLVTLTGSSRGKQSDLYPAFRPELKRYLQKTFGPSLHISFPVEPTRFVPAIDLSFEPRIDIENRLALTTTVYVPKAMQGWSYTSTLVLPLTPDGAIKQVAPLSIGYSSATETMLGETDYDNSRQTSLLVASYSKNGNLMWRSSLYATLSSDVHRRIRELYLHKDLRTERPDFEVINDSSLSDTARNLLAVKVALYSTTKNPDIDYEAAFVYRVSFSTHRSTVQRIGISNEQISRQAALIRCSTN